MTSENLRTRKIDKAPTPGYNVVEDIFRTLNNLADSSTSGTFVH